MEKVTEPRQSRDSDCYLAIAATRSSHDDRGSWEEKREKYSRRASQFRDCDSRS